MIVILLGINLALGGLIDTIGGVLFISVGIGREEDCKGIWVVGKGLLVISPSCGVLLFREVKRMELLAHFIANGK